jgi:hypothetical protein
MADSWTAKRLNIHQYDSKIFKRRMTEYFVEENTILASGGQIVHWRLA